MSTFNDWWNATESAATESAEGLQFADDNFSIAHTGGGCTAWERDIDDSDWFIIITDASGTSHKLDSADSTDHWLVGAQSHDGDFINGVDALTIAEALEIADRLQMEIAMR